MPWRARALGHLCPEPHGREGRLDRVRGLQVHPVLGRVIEETQQGPEVVAELFRGLRPLGTELVVEGLGSVTGVCSLNKIPARTLALSPTPADCQSSGRNFIQAA